ncbi:MAG: methylmalonyl Co-A mutase-associated GTPase MeaB [Flavobacteriaceae bacterium]|nr:methylmalonyl Co-A mutase-associated GTPase MeaB [Flavobacteriaceae bacterium]
MNILAKNKETHQNSIARFQAKRKKRPSTEMLIQGIKDGNRTALSRAITMVESNLRSHKSEAQEIINHCLPLGKKSVRIGITGVPGVGKSSFIESFGIMLTKMGHKIAVLAIDPSSSINKGSILGDKTRMEDLVKDPNAYIRPSASGETLGGVAKKTRESVILCEAAGYNIILIETVGVGQSETAVHSMVDFFLLLKLSGAGDELQGIKRGIMEMADAIAINKADGDNIKSAQKAKIEFQRALHLYPPKENGWSPKVLTCSAIEQKGIESIWKMIDSYIQQAKKSSWFENNRKKQTKNWFLNTIEDRLKDNFYKDPTINEALQIQLRAVEENQTSPFTAAETLLAMQAEIWKKQ